MDGVAAKTELTERKPWQFQPGNRANPFGRPKGARSKLQEDFLADLHAAWKARGPEVIEAAMDEKPSEVLRVVASLLPKQVHVTDDLSDRTTSQLAAIAAWLDDLASIGIDPAGALQEGSGEQVVDLPALPQAAGLP